MSGTVNAKTVRATLGAARALGLDADAPANKWGLSAALTDVDARFPHAPWVALRQEYEPMSGLSVCVSNVSTPSAVSLAAGAGCRARAFVN
jgi:hypothetical protein